MATESKVHVPFLPLQINLYNKCSSSGNIWHSGHLLVVFTRKMSMCSSVCQESNLSFTTSLTQMVDQMGIQDFDKDGKDIF